MQLFAATSAVALLLGIGTGASTRPAAQDSKDATDPKLKLDERAATNACVPAAEQKRPIETFTAQRKREIIACINAQAARDARGQLPVQLDEITTLEAISASGTVLTYRYRVAKDVSEIAPAVVERLGASVREKVCKSEDMRSAIQMGGSYAYAWIDRSGKPIHQLQIDRC